MSGDERRMAATVNTVVLKAELMEKINRREEERQKEAEQKRADAQKREAKNERNTG